ncbi:hypothetical protein [Pseudoxanthomonas winnipegensis]|uniref:hypothetical protein n=1 Tax=Pseudoxanthomonas winnipegensis TaxID=2480810 RepID=UPI003F84DE54
MTEPSDFAPVPPRPRGWDEVFGITGHLRDVPIDQIERGRVDWEYSFDSKDMRPCGRKGCEQKHAHGWVVALSGRRFVNIGNDCARQYAQAGLWSSKINTYRERVSAEARIAALLDVRDEAQRKQYWLDNTPEIKHAINLYESFVQQVGRSFLNEIERRAERGHRIIERDKRLSEQDLQLRRAMLSGSRAESEPGPYVAAIEKVTVGELVGLECFRSSGSPRELHSRLQRLVTTLLKWSPAEGDRDAQRSLVRAKRDLGPLSNQLNSCLVAVKNFFSDPNLKSLMLLEVTRSQGITSIALDENGAIVVTRRPHWHRAA